MLSRCALDEGKVRLQSPAVDAGSVAARHSSTQRSSPPERVGASVILTVSCLPTVPREVGCGRYDGGAERMLGGAAPLTHNEKTLTRRWL